MRAIAIMSVLQTIAVAALLLHSFRTPDRVLLAPEQRSHDLHAAADDSASRVRQPTDRPLTAEDEQRLRTIIREEFAQLQLPPNAQGGGPAPPPESARSEPEDRRRRELVAQQIEAYQAVGSISDLQMLELQTDIAHLDAASRKQMLSKLITSINSGYLKGRL